MNQRILFSVSALVLLGLAVNAQQLLRGMQVLQRSDGPDLGKCTIEFAVDGASKWKFGAAIGMDICKCPSVTGQRVQ